MALPYEQMRELRARSGLSMRAFAAMLGSPLDTRYAYYEERRFTGRLPVDAARQIAAALQPYGIDPRDIFALAGIAAGEMTEAVAAIAPAVQHVRLAVAFPNADALTRMFETMLEKEVPPESRDALARKLALRLPAALQRASASEPVPVHGEAKADSEAAPPSARRRRPLRPESRI